MNWQIDMTLDRYRERVAEAECNYHVQEALYGDRGGKDIASRLLSFTGGLLVSLGKRMQRSGGKPTGALRAGTR